MDVSQSLNCSSVFSALIPSQIFSSEGIQEGARWQFWSSTHLPVSRPSSMSTAALGP